MDDRNTDGIDFRIAKSTDGIGFQQHCWDWLPKAPLFLSYPRLLGAGDSGARKVPKSPSHPQDVLNSGDKDTAYYFIRAMRNYKFTTKLSRELLVCDARDATTKQTSEAASRSQSPTPVCPCSGRLLVVSPPRKMIVSVKWSSRWPARARAIIDLRQRHHYDLCSARTASPTRPVVERTRLPDLDGCGGYGAT